MTCCRDLSATLSSLTSLSVKETCGHPTRNGPCARPPGHKTTHASEAAVTRSRQGALEHTRRLLACVSICTTRGCENLAPEGALKCRECIPISKPYGRHEAGRVYFIVEAGRESEFVKIGRTTGPIEDRVFNLQTGNPRELRLAFAIETEDCAELEKHLHDVYSEYRERGEWFRVEGDLRAFLEVGPGGLPSECL